MNRTLLLLIVAAAVRRRNRRRSILFEFSMPVPLETNLLPVNPQRNLLLPKRHEQERRSRLRRESASSQWPIELQAFPEDGSISISLLFVRAQ